MGLWFRTSRACWHGAGGFLLCYRPATTMQKTNAAHCVWLETLTSCSKRAMNVYCMNEIPKMIPIAHHIHCTSHSFGKCPNGSHSVHFPLILRTSERFYDALISEHSQQKSWLFKSTCLSQLAASRGLALHLLPKSVEVRKFRTREDSK